ncbi:MAG: hypothetical protein DHS20C08_23820 [Rhodomicrobium sp.]|nr:MAG: hypothetical protein DHS20C08_23820 [Rhodomicrobium sp.]
MKTLTLKLLLAILISTTIAPNAMADMSKAGKEAMVAAGHIMFKHRCQSCHSNNLSKPSYGPTLKKVYGRKAGSIVGFNYSDALRKSGIVWNETTLRKWISSNKEMMPGTRMRHVGVTDKAEQNFLIEYLKHISK